MNKLKSLFKHMAAIMKYKNILMNTNGYKAIQIKTTQILKYYQHVFKYNISKSIQYNLI
jgi:hypothetical protein